MRTHAAGVSSKLDVLALEASERSRMQSLVEMLTEARINIREGADPVLLNKEESLLRQINAKERNLMSVAGDSRKVQLLRRIPKRRQILGGNCRGHQNCRRFVVDDGCIDMDRRQFSDGKWTRANTTSTF
jgi:hypothetical protein